MPLDTETAVSGREVAKLSAGAPVMGIVPTSIEDTFRLAELVHQSGLAPYQLKTPQAIAVVLLKGLEIGLKPMAALETIGVINNKACVHSDGIPTLLWSNGFKIREWYENEGDLNNTIACCAITRPDGVEYTFRYSAQDARDNGLWDTRETVKREFKGVWKDVRNDSPWFRYKKRMLRMRCRGWLARDCASDVLKGMPLFEEQQDMVDVTPSEPEPRTLSRPATPVIEDIPDESAAQPQDTPSDTHVQGQDRNAVMSDQQFLDKLDEAYATANDLDTLNENMTANELEIEDRGLQQAAADIYRRHMGRIYDRQ